MVIPDIYINYKLLLLYCLINIFMNEPIFRKVYNTKARI